MLTFIKTAPTILLFCVLGALLQGCGAERDTPFNGGNSNSSSSSLGTKISDVINIINELDEDNVDERTEPSALDSTSKRLVAIRNDEEMESYWDDYINDLRWEEDTTNMDIDFEVGQVLLIDQGELGDCDKLISIRDVDAYDHSPNTVKVVIKYRDSGKSSSSSSSSSSSESSSSSSSSYSEPDCPVNQSESNQPFRFYFIPSRKVMVFQEDIE